MSQCQESKETLSKAKNEKKKKKVKDLCVSARPALGAGRACRFVLGRGRKYRKKGRPVPTAHPQPLPAVLHPTLLCRRPEPRLYRAPGLPPAACLALPGRLPRGTLPPPTEPDLPSRALELRLPLGASSCPARTSHLLPPGGRPQSCSESAHRSFPAGQPSRAPFSRTHRPAALGSPASGRPGPVGGGGGVEAGPPSARGALRGRADAQARSRPRSRTDSPSAHPHAHAGGARRAGSAADASAEARGIPGMRRRPPSAGSAGLRLARQDTPPDTPLPRAGGRPSPGESAGRRGRGLARRGEACFPSPARRTPRGSSHLPGGCGRAPAGNVRCGPGAALGPREEAPVAKGARARHLRRIYVPQGPAVGNTPFSVHAQTNLSCAPGCLLLWASHVPHTHTVGPRTQWTQHT